MLNSQSLLRNDITFIGVNRPAFGGTVPHFHQMSRGPAKSADVPHFSKMALFFSLPIILHVCLATQQSDELRINIGSKFARRQATDYKYTVLQISATDAIYITRVAAVANDCLFFQRCHTRQQRQHCYRSIHSHTRVQHHTQCC